MDVQLYEPGIEFRHQGKDLIILSGGGGEGLEIDDKYKKGKLWYEDQMDFVLKANKPLLGICMGFEVICRAHGSDVPKMPKLLLEQVTFNTTAKGQSLLDEKHLSQFEAHQWRVVKNPKDFDVLAYSQHGIEVIKHRKKPILATQFHPEKTGGTLTIKSLMAKLV